MSNFKVLLVEDDTMISGMYKTRLEQDGYQVKLAANGSEGLSMATEENPDLILLDVMMPQIDGFSLLQELRSKDDFKKIPILMLTNLGTTEDKEKGEKFGATEYLIKADLTPSDVSQTVARYAKKK